MRHGQERDPRAVQTHDAPRSHLTSRSLNRPLHRVNCPVAAGTANGDGPFDPSRVALEASHEATTARDPENDNGGLAAPVIRSASDAAYGAQTAYARMVERAPLAVFLVCSRNGRPPSRRAGQCARRGPRHRCLLVGALRDDCAAAEQASDPPEHVAVEALDSVPSAELPVNVPAAAETTTVVVPTVPVAPVGPVAPVAPVGPAGPVAPVDTVRASRTRRAIDTIGPIDAVNTVCAIGAGGASRTSRTVDTVSTVDTVRAVSTSGASRPGYTIGAIDTVDTVRAVRTSGACGPSRTGRTIGPIDTIDTIGAVDAVSAGRTSRTGRTSRAGCTSHQQDRPDLQDLHRTSLRVPCEPCAPCGPAGPAAPAAPGAPLEPFAPGAPARPAWFHLIKRCPFGHLPPAEIMWIEPSFWIQAQ